MLYNSRRNLGGAGVACLLTMGLALPGLSQGIFNQNLVANPGAEAGAGIESNEQEPIKDVPGWTLTGGFTVAKYDSPNLMGISAYGPSERGVNYFSAGPGGGKSNASQTIDVSAAAAEIDAGRVRFYLSGYLGGSAQRDFLGGLKATFKDAAGKALLTTTVKGATSEEMNLPEGLLSRSASGFLLPNTRSVEIVLDMTGGEEQFSTAGADNLSLILTKESMMGVNLVVNGDAETPNDAFGSTGSSTPLIGWSTQPSTYATTYEDARIGADSAGPQERGRYLIIGSGAGSGSRLYQTIDVTLAKDMIDAGGVAFGFSAYLGGYQDSLDNAGAKAEFLDAAENKLGEAVLGTVTVEDRGGVGALLPREASGSIPGGTRQVRVSVVFGASAGDPAYLGWALADSVKFGMVAPAADLRIKDSGIISSASGQSGAVAPGEIVNVLTTGVDLSTVVRMQLDNEGKVSKELGGVKVFFDGTQAPLLYVNSSEVRAIVPFDVDGKSTVQVRLEYKGVKSNTVSVTVAPTAPGVFTQEGTPKGAALAYDAGWSLVSASNPAAKGSTVTVIWTGGGQTNPGGVDGRIETQSLPKPKATVTATIGGQPATVSFAGALPFSWAGLMMAQIQVPSSVAAGNAADVALTANGVTSPAGVTIAIK